MKYICVENQGLIQVDDLKLIGSSSKRGVDGKIGMFGSGWKYALAWLIRNDAAPTIYSGTKEIAVGYNYKLHRDNPVRVITFDGEESSLTAEMGPKWQGWMAFREVFSNAIDEGGHSVKMDLTEEDIHGVDDMSRVYIPVTEGMIDVITNFNTYFSFNMMPTFSNEHGKLFVYDSPKEIHHFRKGIRCYNSGSSYRNSKIAIDFNEIEIDEDRLAKHWDVSKSAINYIRSCDNVSALELIMCNTDSGYHPDTATPTMIDAFKSMNAKGIKFSTIEMSRLLPTSPDTVIINSKLLQHLVESEVIDHPMSKWIKNSLGFVFIPDEDYIHMQNNIHYHLSDCIPNCTVSVGKMSDDTKYTTEKIDGTKEKSYKFFVSTKFVGILSERFDGETGTTNEVEPELVAKKIAAQCLIDLEDLDIIAGLFR